MGGEPHLSPFSGAWYPCNPRELDSLLDRCWRTSAERSPARRPHAALAYVVPHAGIEYSGTVAAAVYRRIAEQPPPSIVVLGFSHHGGRSGIHIPDVGAIATPYGAVQLDRETAELLIASGAAAKAPEDTLCDHSVEIQLPFLQRSAPAAQLLPLYVNRPDEAGIARAAEALASLAKRGAVLLASTDLTHYGRSFGYQPFPLDSRTGDRIAQLDDSVTDAASSVSAEMFDAVLRETSATVCGRDPVRLLLRTLALLDGDEEIYQAKLDSQTSGEITGDFSHSVSYAALAYHRRSAFLLSEPEAAWLLESARGALGHYLRTMQHRGPDRPPSGLGGLEMRLAAFVSVYVSGELRGCVGRVEPDTPLWRLVPELALSSALEDSRFRPVSPGDTDWSIEVSVLTPFRRMGKQSEFVAGVHGAALGHGLRRGLLLPQVASMRGWGADEFFRALAMKAGVSGEVYHEGSAVVHKFRSQLIA